ncbi:MAG: M48 family metallopeptidase [Gemmatimonadales bacterium]|nr:M48 family metallopeptidase [Gemmatimonadales bacterium]
MSVHGTNPAPAAQTRKGTGMGYSASPSSAQDATARTDPVPVPEPTALALQYHRSGNLLWALDTTAGVLIPAAILFTGLSARLRSLAVRISRGRWLPMVAVYAILFVALTALLTLPLSWYAGFIRQHAYGLSNQTPGAWLGEWATGLAVGCVVAALVLWIPYLLLRLSPRRWWLWTGVATIPLSVLGLLVGPIWIAPLFDDFGPMKDPALEARILTLAGRAGIEGGRVYQVDKSADTKTVNAYVTGVGATRRIVLWDTILAKLRPDEILFVMGHEMGHFVLRHTLSVILGAAILATLSLYLVQRIAGGLIQRFRGRFGFERLSDVASLPLLVLLGGVVSFVASPVALAWSRRQEHEADRFGLEITRDNRAAALTFVRLQQENLGVPRPGLIYTLWRGSHPAVAERIEFANSYRPWATGGEMRYHHLFRPCAPRHGRSTD